MDKDQRHTITFSLLCRHNNDVAAARDSFAVNHLTEPLPSRTSFYRIIKKVRETGKNITVRKAREKTVVDGPFYADLIRYADNNNRASVREAAAEFGLSVSSVWRMWSKVKQPYKKRKFHRIPERNFLPQENPNFFYDVCFTDENTFTNNGPRNQQTERMWMYKGQNPNWVDERNRYPDFKIMVFADVVYDSIVGPYFFEGNLNSRIWRSSTLCKSSETVIEASFSEPMNRAWWSHSMACDIA
ncbi:hypothetical protein TKK_0012490 [Trichogramma kaykai]